MKKVTFYILIFTIFPSTAFAYLDPGIGSIILQLLVAGIISISVAVTNIRIKISNFFKSIFFFFKKKKNKKTK